VAGKVDFIRFINSLPKDALPTCGQCGGGVLVSTSASIVQDEIELAVYCQPCGTSSVGGVTGKVLCALDDHEIVHVFMDKLAEIAHHLAGGVNPPRQLVSYPSTPKDKEPSKEPFMRKDAPWNV
jgi:hypothetical protein